MISIITSSYKQKQFKAFSENVEKTIGLPYEIVQVWNPGKMGITQAYNQGAKKAKYDHLLFIHEDVEFKTLNWGKLLLEHFTLPNVGVIGMAGSKKKFNYPSGFVAGNYENDFIFVDHINIPLLYRKEFKKYVPVKVLDGVFLSMKKKVWENIQFNEFYKGFHFYDLDISLRASYKYQNYSVSNIVMIHNSLGNFGNDWVEASLLFHKQDYKFDKPTEKDLQLLRRCWYNKLSNEKVSLKNKIRYTRMMGIDWFSKRPLLRFLFSLKYQSGKKTVI